MQQRYRVEVEKDVQKALKRFPTKTRQRVWEAIEALGKTPRPRGCKKLDDDIYRIRVGLNYRVVYSINDREKEVLVTGAFTRETGY